MATLKPLAEIQARLDKAKGRLTSNYGHSANEELLSEISILEWAKNAQESEIEGRLMGARFAIAREDYEGTLDERELDETIQQIDILRWVLDGSATVKQ